MDNSVVASLGPPSGACATYGAPMEPDRWDRLADSLWVDDELDLAMVEAVAEGERAQAGLAHRLQATDWVTVGMSDATVTGAVDLIGTESLLLRDESGWWMVPLSSIDHVEGLRPALRAQSQVPSQRVGMAAMLRRWTGERLRVYRRGRCNSGVLCSVGSDHLDLAAETGGCLTIPFHAIMYVRRCE